MGIPRIDSPVYHMALGEAKEEQSFPLAVIELAVGEEEG